MIAVIAFLAVACTTAPAGTPIVIFVTPEPAISPTSTTALATSSPQVATPASTTAATSMPRPTLVSRTPRPTATTPTYADIEIVDLGFSTYKGKYDDGHNLSWAVIVRNPNTNAIAHDVELVVDFVDATGALVETVSDSWAAILPGQTVALGDEISYFSNDDLRNAAEVEVQVFHGDEWEVFSGTPGVFSFDSIRTRADSIGSLDTTARISSSFVQDIENPYVVAVYRRDGEIVGGGWTFAERVPAGGQVGVDIFGPGISNVDETEMYAHFSYLSF